MTSLAEGTELLFELLRVLVALPSIESARGNGGPARFLPLLRRRGRRAAKRGRAGRERLRFAIRWIDARFPGGPNCYRRALLETALDRDAARLPLVLGLRAGGGRDSGHAWLGERDGNERYDVELTL